jgi:hypothetical protein
MGDEQPRASIGNLLDMEEIAADQIARTIMMAEAQQGGFRVGARRK